jgi:hypothetical protein
MDLRPGSLSASGSISIARLANCTVVCGEVRFISKIEIRDGALHKQINLI